MDLGGEQCFDTVRQAIGRDIQYVNFLQVISKSSVSKVLAQHE